MEETPKTDGHKLINRHTAAGPTVQRETVKQDALYPDGEEDPTSQVEESMQGVPFDRSLWKATVESMLDPVTVCDANGKAVYMNSAYSRLVGFGIGHDVPPEQHALHYRLYTADGTLYESADLPLQRAALRDEEIRGAEVVHVASNGQRIYTVWNASPIHSASGAVVGAVAVGRDVTDQRRADETQALLAAIVESSDDAIIGKTLDGTVTSWNQGAQRLYGYSADEMVGKSIATIIPDEGIPEFKGIMAGLARGERIRHLETTRKRKDGSRVTVSLTISPILNREGQIVGASTVARDFTAQRQAQMAERFLGEASTALSESLEYEDTLDRAAKLAVPLLGDLCVVNVIEGQKIRQSTSSREGFVFGECLSGMERGSSGDPNGSHPIWQVMRTSSPRLLVIDPAPGQVSEGVLPETMVQSGARACLVVPLVIRGRPVGAISLISTNPSRKYTDADLRVAMQFASRVGIAIDNAQLYRDARNAVTARDEFLSIAAHELKTPMTSLRGFVQLAIRQMSRDGGMDPATAHQAMRVIDQQSRRLSSLISQLLDVTRLEAGRLSLERRIVDLSSMVESIVAAVGIANTEHVFTIDIQPGLLALVDPVRIEQVVSALLENAAKFSPLGTIVELTLSQASHDSVRLTVRDSGPGVPPELRPHIFTRFYHGHPNEHAGGMGLGLYMSREIVLLHGGTIDAEFPESGGSLFVVILPTSLGELAR